MRASTLALAAALCSCGTPAARPLPPSDLAACATAPRQPEPMPPIRVPQRLLEHDKATEAARLGSVAARNDCAGKLHALNDWITRHR